MINCSDAEWKVRYKTAVDVITGNLEDRNSVFRAASRLLLQTAQAPNMALAVPQLQRVMTMVKKAQESSADLLALTAAPSYDSNGHAHTVSGGPPAEYDLVWNALMTDTRRGDDLYRIDKLFALKTCKKNREKT